MRPIRLLSHLLNAMFVVALGLCILTSADNAKADEEPQPAAATFCGGCPVPNNTPCALTTGARCGFFVLCNTCFCVPDPLGLPGPACVI